MLRKIHFKQLVFIEEVSRKKYVINQGKKEKMLYMSQKYRYVGGVSNIHYKFPNLISLSFTYLKVFCFILKVFFYGFL